MTSQALARSKKALRPAHVCDDMIERFTGKLLTSAAGTNGRPFEEVDEIGFRSFARRAERSAADFFGLGDLLVLVFTRAVPACSWSGL